jgi:UDP-N-acetylmuramyl tripeptide synthase
VGKTGTAVLNADDEELVKRRGRIAAGTVWFSLDPGSPLISDHTAAGGAAAWLEGNTIVLARGGDRDDLISLDQVPITFKGAARHNVANVLAAVSAARALGVEQRLMPEALRQFGRFAGDNPGRANLFEVGGVRLLLDYAHNPHGMSALVNVAQRLPGARRLIMVGQAGDRDDDAIRELARAAWALHPDRVIVKEMDQYLRGRAPGAVPRLLAEEFLRLGLASEAVSIADKEIDGARTALHWAEPGDLLVLAVHQERRAVLGLISSLATSGWQAGQSLPG